jgi:hypothetical protein
VSQHYVCLTGGRDFRDRALMAEIIGFLHAFYREQLRIMHGDAPGADRMADVMARQLDVPVKPFPADWDGLGKAAGALRNTDMVNYLEMCRRKKHSVQVVAFPGNVGTRDMIKQSMRAGIDVDPIGWEP